MDTLILLIGISVSVAAIFLGAFLWAVKSGQFDDDYTPSVRMLFDDQKADNKQSQNKPQNKTAHGN